MLYEHLMVEKINYQNNVKKYVLNKCLRKYKISAYGAFIKFKRTAVGPYCTCMYLCLGHFERCA